MPGEQKVEIRRSLTDPKGEHAIGVEDLVRRLGVRLPGGRCDGRTLAKTPGLVRRDPREILFDGKGWGRDEMLRLAGLAAARRKVELLGARPGEPPVSGRLPPIQSRLQSARIDDLLP